MPTLRNPKNATEADMKKTLLPTLLISMLAGCEQDAPPFDVEAFEQHDDFYKVTHVEIRVTATDENVEIHDIIVNRGNCSARSSGNKELPHKLSFGETFNRTFLGPCSAKQVDIFSNLGEWTWNY